MNWRWIWAHAQAIWAWTAAVIAVLLAIYYGPKKLLETWDWYLDRFFDSKVRRVLNEARSKPLVWRDGKVVRYGMPVNVAELAKQSGLKESRVLSALARLRKKEEAIEHSPGEWKAPDKHN